MKTFAPAVLTILAIQLSSPLLPAASVSIVNNWRPYVISRPAVVYPEVIKRNGVNGRGIFLVRIDRNSGAVTEVKVVKSTGHRQLDAIYVLNFFQWKFQPGTIGWARIPRGVQILGRANIYHEYD
jgi:TonB family protein